jgi:hypothetical protein
VLTVQYIPLSSHDDLASPDSLRNDFVHTQQKRLSIRATSLSQPESRVVYTCYVGVSLLIHDTKRGDYGLLLGGREVFDFAQKRALYSSSRPDWLWSPASLISYGHRDSSVVMSGHGLDDRGIWPRFPPMVTGGCFPWGKAAGILN